MTPAPLPGIRAECEMNAERQKPKLFSCQSCGQVLGYRRGDTLIAFLFEIDFPRTRKILCKVCGKRTIFHIDREKRVMLQT